MDQQSVPSGTEVKQEHPDGGKRPELSLVDEATVHLKQVWQFIYLQEGLVGAQKITASFHTILNEYRLLEQSQNLPHTEADLIEAQGAGDHRPAKRRRRRYASALTYPPPTTQPSNVRTYNLPWAGDLNHRIAFQDLASWSSISQQQLTDIHRKVYDALAEETSQETTTKCFDTAAQAMCSLFFQEILSSRAAAEIKFLINDYNSKDYQMSLARPTRIDVKISELLPEDTPASVMEFLSPFFSMLTLDPTNRVTATRRLVNMLSTITNYHKMRDWQYERLEDLKYFLTAYFNKHPGAESGRDYLLTCFTHMYSVLGTDNNGKWDRWMSQHNALYSFAEAVGSRGVLVLAANREKFFNMFYVRETRNAGYWKKFGQIVKQEFPDFVRLMSELDEHVLQPIMNDTPCATYTNATHIDQVIQAFNADNPIDPRLLNGFANMATTQSAAGEAFNAQPSNLMAMEGIQMPHYQQPVAPGQVRAETGSFGTYTDRDLAMNNTSMRNVQEMASAALGSIHFSEYDTRASAYSPMDSGFVSSN